MYERLIEGSVADVPMQETALGAGLVAGGHGWPSQCRRSAAKSFLVLCLSRVVLLMTQSSVGVYMRRFRPG